MINRYPVHALLALAVLAGCRAQQAKTEGEPVAAPAEGGDGGSGGDGEDDGPGLGEGGPKVMGYQYLFRGSYAALSGTYSDRQANDSAGLEGDLPEVALTGKRLQLEHYPIVYENFPHSQYGYAAIDLRTETSDTDWWDTRDTMVLLMGYILPKWRLLAPVVGVHWEFNKIDMGLPDSPEVIKSDLRALLIGADFRQKISGIGSWLGFFYAGKLHLLNLGQKSNGFEAEAGLGSTLQLGLFRSEVTLGYLEQRYKGERAASAEDSSLLRIASRYKATYLQWTLWL